MIRRILTTAIFTFACAVCLLTADISVAAQTTKPSPEVKSTPEVKPSPQVKPMPDATAEMNFPDVEGWEKGEVTRFPTKDLGYSVNYESPVGGRVTIYVYSGGEKTIPNDLKSSVLKNQIAKAQSEIESAVQAGYYESAKLEKSGEMTLGGKNGKTSALFALYTLGVNNRELVSEIYLFGFQNQFIKIRASRLKDKAGKTNETTQELLTEIDTLFADLNLLTPKSEK